MIHFIRPASRPLLVAPLLALCLAGSLAAFLTHPISPAHAQEVLPVVPVVTIEANQDIVVEGENATFTLTRTTGPLDEELTVRALTQEPDHPEATDNSNPTRRFEYVDFSAGSATATLTAPTDDDGVSEVTDSLEAQILPWNNAPVDYEIGDPSQVTVTITDRVAVVTVT